MKSADFWLYEIAERLRCFGLTCVDNSLYLLDSDSDSDSDYGCDYGWDYGDEYF